MVIDEIRSEFAKLQHHIRSGPIYPHVTREEIRGHLLRYYNFSTPLDLEDVVADIEQLLRSWQVQVTHPHYFGLFNPSVTLASVVADTLVGMYNPQLASWRTSPAANEIERHTLDWFARQFGLPGNTRALFTTGGAEANLTAVIVALTRAFPEYGNSGLRSLGVTPAIYLTQESHHSFRKIAHMTGLGRNALRLVHADSQQRMNPAALAAGVAEDRRNGFFPLMVIGTCGTTTSGAIDPLPELGRFCREANLWFHVDAAWGGAAIISPSLRHHLAGIEAADSITCDAHKWLSVSMGCGMFFCRHPESVSEAFRAEAAYMPGKPSDSAFDPYTESVQWSRRFIGLRLFLSLAEHGASGHAEMIDRQSRMGCLLRDSLAASGWQIANHTPFPVVCFTRSGLDIAAFVAALREGQIAWMSEVQLAGSPVVRSCITSFRTTERDILWLVDQMNRLVARDEICAPACVAS
jgi:glutamate/tyrosine decarboxylase-like PLP-dependent enzyme